MEESPAKPEERHNGEAGRPPDASPWGVGRDVMVYPMTSPWWVGKTKKGGAGAATCVPCRSSGDTRSQKSSQEETENMTHNMTLAKKSDVAETTLRRQAPLS